ncbi:hypothetical protein M422DRAFT_49534 [Sphaerobolus stellatus SS14]|uniref:Uncharacterized protein n=1 Tax=Sphaerobolus stellatus (strain SS14) TaxID=990650 RepID=A0A0C9UXR9_SPHS4|nr:hypothetical protein M422DRAFT_49534 [Sphaerobolus stellatus SS14]
MVPVGGHIGYVKVQWGILILIFSTSHRRVLIWLPPIAGAVYLPRQYLGQCLGTPQGGILGIWDLWGMYKKGTPLAATHSGYSQLDRCLGTPQGGILGIWDLWGTYKKGTPLAAAHSRYSVPPKAAIRPVFRYPSGWYLDCRYGTYTVCESRGGDFDIEFLEQGDYRGLYGSEPTVKGYSSGYCLYQL